MSFSVFLNDLQKTKRAENWKQMLIKSLRLKYITCTVFSLKHRKYREEDGIWTSQLRPVSGLIRSSAIRWTVVQGCAVVMMQVKKREWRRTVERRQGASLPSSFDNYLSNQCWTRTFSHGTSPACSSQLKPYSGNVVEVNVVVSSCALGSAIV